MEYNYLRIYNDHIDSNVENFEFSWEYIGKGSTKSPTYLNLVDATFVSKKNEPIHRQLEKYENKKKGILLARLAMQVFEENLDSLSEMERRNIKTDGTGNNIGLWSDKTELKEEWGNGINAGKKKSKLYVADKFLGNAYPSLQNAKYYFYNAGLYDSICLAQSLLDQFGNNDDYFEIIVFQNPENPNIINEPINSFDDIQREFVQEYTDKLLCSKNIIFRGAPGTGKTYLAKQVAAMIISNYRTYHFEELTEAERKQYSFVQFHPSFDYTDFVEGLRPVNTENQMTFELRNGIFKNFCDNIRLKQKINYTDSFTLAGFGDFLDGIGSKHKSYYLPYVQQLLGLKEYKGKKVDHFPTYDSLLEIVEHAEEIKEFDREYDFHQWLVTPVNYVVKYHDLCEENKKNQGTNDNYKYVFIIDEINRGELSKIFGELFFSIDPAYRGAAGSVTTQYSNLHLDDKEMFYIPDNVYIIGTMNDIDRSVDTFDFAMRRRFRFITILAEDTRHMLYKESNRFNGLDNVIANQCDKRMTSLNKAISSGIIPELNENYHIGPSYFLKIKELENDFDVLWEDYILPLIEEYLRGIYGSEEMITYLFNAYNLLPENELLWLYKTIQKMFHYQN